eukprot:GILJ01011975.1.p1 GENE.GILJ01011975.1~~GILJ01011975.1.p1  ORF type:complete len:211 (-),score=15.32 GILJ01011975.1:286-897(-)
MPLLGCNRLSPPSKEALERELLRLQLVSDEEQVLVLEKLWSWLRYESTRRSMVELGILPVLACLIRNGSKEVRVNAVMTLSMLTRGPNLFVESNVGPSILCLLEFLREETDEFAKKEAISGLCRLLYKESHVQIAQRYDLTILRTLTSPFEHVRKKLSELRQKLGLQSSAPSENGSVAKTCAFVNAVETSIPSSSSTSQSLVS